MLKNDTAVLDHAEIIDQTQSVCPVCLKVIDAQIVVQDRAVYMEKTCPEHGKVITYVWPDIDHYRWMSDLRLPLKKPQVFRQSQQGCPHDCGFCTSHLRHCTLAEIEVTERCNLRCPVCFMAAEAAKGVIQHDFDLQIIEDKYKAILAQSGAQTSIQLTGGEPTICKNLPEIVRMGRRIGFDYIEVNTNGVVIARDPAYIQELAEAGISGIYMQFDGLTGDVYAKIRGENILEYKLKAIENCRKVGVQVVLAMTVIEGINEDQMGDVLNFALQNRDVIAGLAYQPAFGSGRFDVTIQKRLTMGDVAFMLADQSKGLIQPYDFLPLGCSHPICSSATYIIEEKGHFLPFTRQISPQEYIEAFNPDSPQGSVLGDIASNKYPDLVSGVSIVIMNYMDAFSMDLKRLKECSMTVARNDGCLVPFCSYQLTNIDGKRMSDLFAPEG
ncbi:radical SAM protein [Dehalobacter sp. DCM]|uniref:radical SAM protein n=1 Tax=Dehalobacter sp. DCM TaxID=2907827 RepID=UPI0030813AD9|nr:radical SAM protein [Dehalobacter sp. DCM]